MRKYILYGGICFLVSISSYAQLGLFHTDEVTLTEPTFENIVAREFPSNGAINGSYPDGKIRYSASVKNSRLHGEWKSWYGNNAPHDEGKLVKGVPDGEWKVWYPNGKLRYVRTYSSDKLMRIQQEWTRPHPKMPNFALTNLYQKDKSKALTAVKSNYSFKEAIASNSYTPVFNRCLHHGLFINYYESGMVKDSGYYNNGLRTGVWQESLPAGNEYWTGTYKNGVKTGTWKRFNKQKKMMELIVYKNGSPNWRKEF